MNRFEKRVKADELVAGMALYPVFSVSGSVASTEEPVVVGVAHDIWRSPISERTADRMIDSNGRDFFYRDHNIEFERSIRNPDEQYNFHALFKTEEDAKAAAAEINIGDLSPTLAEVRDRLVKHRQDMRDCEDDQW